MGWVADRLLLSASAEKADIIGFHDKSPGTSNFALPAARPASSAMIEAWEKPDQDDAVERVGETMLLDQPVDDGMVFS